MRKYDQRRLKIVFATHVKPSFCAANLSGSLSKSGSLDLGFKNSFPSFFVSEKGLAHIYIYKRQFIIFQFLIFALLRAKIELLVSRYPAAGKCFQNTPYPAVWNFARISTEKLIQSIFKL